MVKYGLPSLVQNRSPFSNRVDIDRVNPLQSVQIERGLHGFICLNKTCDIPFDSSRLADFRSEVKIELIGKLTKLSQYVHVGDKQ